MSPAGWFPDPMARYEFRYFNGHQWTADVSVGGTRFVDPAGSPSTPPVVPAAGHPPGVGGPGMHVRRSRGLAVTSFVVGLLSVVLGWVPLMAVLGVVGVVVGLTLGIFGLRRAREQQGYGKGFAIWGIVLSAVAIPVCALGLWFTVVVFREVNDYVNPGPYSLGTPKCLAQDGTVSMSGTIRNDGTSTEDFVVVVVFERPGGDQLAKESIEVDDVAPGTEGTYRSSVLVFGDADTVCRVQQVFGPTPFGLPAKDLDG